MTSPPPPRDQSEPFDPPAPMASDFEYQSGSAYSTPNPFIKDELPPDPAIIPGGGYANPNGSGVIDYGLGSEIEAATPQNPYAQGQADPNPYAVQQPDYQAGPYAQGQAGPYPYTAQQSGYQAGPYGPPSAPYAGYGGYAGYGQVQKLNAPALVGMILSIVSIFLCYFGILTGIVGAILGGVGLSKIGQDPAGQKGRGMAIVAIVLGIVTAVFWGVLLILVAATQ